MRFLDIFFRNGAWGAYVIFQLLFNRVLVSLQRLLLGVDDIYFQGAPRIINRKKIKFKKNFRCGRGAWIEAVATESLSPAVKIEFGDNFTASENLHVAALNGVFIGSGVLIGSNVLITDHSHGDYGANGSEIFGIPPNNRNLFSKGPVIIGSNVWIADGVKVLSGVTIGDGAVISANTVVKSDVPRGAIYGQAVIAKTYKIYDQNK